MTNTKKRHLEILETARRIIEDQNINIAKKVSILPLAKSVKAETGCHITTAKNNVAKAIRQMRGEIINSSNWGGNRANSGRPPKRKNLYDG